MPAIKSAMEKYRGRKVYVGFSGGADSTALLLWLHQLAEELELRLEAVHFDHLLRPESGSDARWCEEFCCARKIPFRGERLALETALAAGETVEAAARQGRLAAWKRIAETGSVIALGHHGGDRVENLLLRLCRGSNVSALTSMRREQVIDGMTFIRPLLDSSREELMEFLRANEISEWREDASNRDNRYQRNFLRNQILPEIYREQPAAEKGLRRSLEVLEQDADFIEMAAAGIFANWNTAAGLEIARFNRLHPAMAIRILRLWLQQACGEDIIPERHALERLAGVDDNGETTGIPLRGGRELQVRRGMITLAEATTKNPPETVEWHWRKQRHIRFGAYSLTAEAFPAAEGLQASGINAAGFALEKLPETLVLRGWREGDQMIPFGKKTAVKLKKIFTDAKISPEKKKATPLLCLPDGTVIWVAGIRRSSFAPVEPDKQAMIFYI